MKNKKLIFSFTLALTLLFSILFQSFHSYEHLAKQFNTKACYHQYNTHNHTEITHHHKALDICYVCNFVFSSYVASTTFAFQTVVFDNVILYFFTIPKTIFSFSGSMYSHRGPPVLL